MASGLSSVVFLVLSVALTPCVFGGDDDCLSYTDGFGKYHSRQYCYFEFCCGSCNNRYCCSNSFQRFSEDEQEICEFSTKLSTVPMVIGIGMAVLTVLIFICCCVCPWCCLYKACRRPRPVVATTTHTTVVTRPGQQYPQQTLATPSQPQVYQGAQYPPYQPVPVQQGYGTQPMPQAYGAQPTTPYPAPVFTPGPPPTYQEATGPTYPPNPAPYSQAAFNPNQPAYPAQPPTQPQPNAPFAHTDFLSQPAYNPDYVAPKTG